MSYNEQKVCVICGEKINHNEFETHVVQTHNISMLSYEVTYGRKINEATKNNQRVLLTDSGKGNLDIGDVI